MIVAQHCHPLPDTRCLELQHSHVVRGLEIRRISGSQATRTQDPMSVVARCYVSHGPDLAAHLTHVFSFLPIGLASLRSRHLGLDNDETLEK